MFTLFFEKFNILLFHLDNNKKRTYHLKHQIRTIMLVASTEKKNNNKNPMHIHN